MDFKSEVMKVLITGGTGFIGVKLKNTLVEKGYQVHVLVRDVSKYSSSLQVKYFEWNTQSLTIDSNAFEGVEAIINLAGKNINCRWNTKNKQEILESRLRASKTLYNFLSTNSHQVKHILHASAIGIYPSSLHNQYDENQEEFNNAFLGSICQQWEKANTSFEQLGIKNAFVRIGLVLDSKKGALPEMKKLVAFGIGNRLGTGKQYYSWIHQADLIRLMLHIVENQLEGIYNGVSSEPVTQFEFNNELALVLKKKFWIPQIPSLLFKIGLGERSQLLLDSQYVMNQKILDSGYTFQFTNVQAALKDIYK